MLISWIQNFFHTDKWWGKTIFVILTYVLYWCVFYGSLLFIPNSDYNTELNTSLPFIFVLIIVPVISFFVPKFIKKVFYINKTFLYSLHLFFVLLSIIIFFIVAITSAFSHIQMG